MHTKLLHDDNDPNNKQFIEAMRQFNLNKRLLATDIKLPDIDDGVDALHAVQNRQIGLYIETRNTELVIDLKSITFLGRSYPQHSYFNGVDLSAFGAYSNGVSRQHCALLHYDDDLAVVDQHSANGTYLNGQPLQPAHAYRVEHDDFLILGLLKIVIDLSG